MKNLIMYCLTKNGAYINEDFSYEIKRYRFIVYVEVITTNNYRYYLTLSQILKIIF